MDLLIILIALAFMISLYTLYTVFFKKDKLESGKTLRSHDQSYQFETSKELFGSNEESETDEDSIVTNEDSIETNKDSIETDKESFEISEELFEKDEESLPRIVFPPDPVKESVPDVPRGYDDNKITIMARDPEWIYAYWNLNHDYYEGLKNSYRYKWEHSYPVLRVFEAESSDMSNTSSDWYDIRINDDTDNWYIKIPSPDKIYQVELGRILQDGEYLVLLRSNNAHTPRNTISDKVDPAWMLVSDKEKKLFGSIGHQENFSSVSLIKNELKH